MRTTSAAPPNRLLYAAVPAAEAEAARSVARTLGVVVEGPTAAITGAPSRAKDVAGRAVAHDKLMQKLLERCSSVVPFRLDMRAPPKEALSRMLRDHREALAERLERFRDRVEMGVKVRTKGAGSLDLSPLHALAPDPRDRKERYLGVAGGAVFEGTYLIERAQIDAFWSALEALRGPEHLPVLGTGPWAPYSFCDFQIETRAAF